MLKMMMILLAAVLSLICEAECKEGTNSLTDIMIDVRTQIRQLVAKVNGIDSRVGRVENEVNGIDERFGSLSQDVNSLKRGFEGNPFSSCNGSVITVTGTTIKYPLTGEYRPYENCTWTVNAGDNVKVSFTKLDTEGLHDCVEIFSSGQLKGRWCGHSVPSDDVVLNGCFTVHFHSDYGAQYSGFQIEIGKNE